MIFWTGETENEKFLRTEAFGALDCKNLRALRKHKILLVDLVHMS